MKYAIRVLGYAAGVPCPVAGQFCKSFDFEADEGRGFGEFTENTADCKQFDSIDEAMAFYMTQSDTVPVRDDGQPNRPFTVSTIEILAVGMDSPAASIEFEKKFTEGKI